MIHACNAVTVEPGAGRSVVTRLLARSPLRLLTPRNAGGAAWIFTSSYGGGLVAGDHVELEVTVAAGATALVGTQAQTKVYRGASTQETRATVGEGGLLCWLPDAVVPYAGAAYSQRLDVTLDGGSLVLVEALHAGRTARGERWAFARYASRIRVVESGRRSKVEGQRFRNQTPDPELSTFDLRPSTILEDALLLDPEHGPLPARLGRFDALATVLALGPRAAPIAAALRPDVGEDCLVAASEVAGGVLARVAATSSAALALALRRLTAGLPALLGDDPLARKW